MRLRTAGLVCVALVAGGLLASCGAPIVNVTPVVSGQVLYECREYDPAVGALGVLPVLRPVVGWAILVTVNGVEMSRVVTDDTGHYRVFAAHGDHVVLTCLAGREPDDRNDGVDFQVYDPGADEWSTADDVPYNVSAIVDVDVSREVNLVAPLTVNGGAFAICNSMNSGFEQLAKAGLVTPAKPMPHLRFYWRRGMTSFQGTSGSFFLSGGANLAFIKSFTTGQEDTTCEEAWSPHAPLGSMGFFVMERFSAKSTNGGGSCDMYDADPCYQFQRGFANFWGTLCTGEPVMREMAGYGATGTVDWEWTPEPGFFPADPEAATCTFGGLYSLYSIWALLLDCYDGPVTRPPDTDPEGLGPGIQAILTVLTTPGGFKDKPFGTFYDFADGWQALYPATFPALVARMATEHIPWPPSADERVPALLVSGATVVGHCDSTKLAAGLVTDHHMEAQDLYRVHLDAPGTIDLTLTIAGSGATPEDLDLYIYSPAWGTVASASTANPVESLSYAAEAGDYLIRVQAWDAGANYADYSLLYALH